MDQPSLFFLSSSLFSCSFLHSCSIVKTWTTVGFVLFSSFRTGFHSHHSGRASSCTSRLRRSIPTNGAKRELADGSIRCCINKHQHRLQRRRSSAVFERLPKAKIDLSIIDRCAEAERRSLNLHHCRNIQSIRRSNIVREQKRIDRKSRFYLRRIYLGIKSVTRLSRIELKTFSSAKNSNRTRRNSSSSSDISRKNHRQNTVVKHISTFFLIGRLR